MSGEPTYTLVAPDFDNSIALPAARDLMFKGRKHPGGYTEPVRHAGGLELKTATV